MYGPLLCVVLRGSTGSEEGASIPRAFHCIKFATPSQPTGNGRQSAEAELEEQEEELLAVSASLHLFHFANAPLAELEVRILL